jgi:mannose-6-phosphate isomerase
MALSQRIFLLEPQARERVWGGQRLMPRQPPIGELWCAYGQSRVLNGAAAGQTVDDLITHHGPIFVGDVVAARFPGPFPLLIKLLDCADWLSVQVHPDDEQAARLEGPGHRGKTEAWHFIDAAPGAMIMAGVRPGITPHQLAEAIRTGRILDVSPSIAVRAGETYLLHAGTMHALGPGLMLYEVQQSSDITYRVYDWDRPASAGRELHIEQAVAVTDAARQAVRTSAPPLEDAAAVAVDCSYFALDVLNVSNSPSSGDTGGATFHILTVKSGAVDVMCGTESVRLERFNTAIVAGGAGPYDLRAIGPGAAVLRARVPDRQALTPRGATARRPAPA